MSGMELALLFTLVLFLWSLLIYHMGKHSEFNQWKEFLAGREIYIERGAMGEMHVMWMESPDEDNDYGSY